MSEKAFTLEDTPTELGVSSLTRSLRDDCANKGVSPKVYAHRARVIRQQTERLALQIALDADCDGNRLATAALKAPSSLQHRETGGEG
jgi:hypothetical protein